MEKQLYYGYCPNCGKYNEFFNHGTLIPSFCSSCGSKMNYLPKKHAEESIPEFIAKSIGNSRLAEVVKQAAEKDAEAKKFTDWMALVKYTEKGNCLYVFFNAAGNIVFLIMPEEEAMQKDIKPGDHVELGLNEKGDLFVKRVVLEHRKL